MRFNKLLRTPLIIPLPFPFPCEKHSSPEKDGQTVYTTEVIAEEIDFGETKAERESSQTPENNSGQTTSKGAESKTKDDDFMVAPDDIDMSQLPFN